MNRAVARSNRTNYSPNRAFRNPPIDIRPIEGQIDDLLGEIQDRIAKMNVY